MTMAAAAIKINKLDQGIFEMVMSYPERRNALTLEMWQAIPDALAPLQTDDTLRALIIRGDGEHFSAGADISEFERVFSGRESARELYTAMKKTCLLYTSPSPRDATLSRMPSSA